MARIHTHISIPPVLKKMQELFSKNGFTSYLVGGAVRDILMKKEVHDYDVATNAMPNEVMQIFHKVILTGIEHGTVTVHLMGHQIEVTTFRSEGTYSDGRHPDSVSYNVTIEEDLSRRDFTMNAIAVNLLDGSILDPFFGQNDIKNKIIRAVGNPLERFLEDGLRPIRAIRFASQLNFCIENHTYSDIFEKKVLEKVSSISVERFREEFTKIMLSDLPSTALKLLEETGILNIFIPEFLKARNCVQHDERGFHGFDVLDHSFYACDGAEKSNLTVRLASLFHDIGKPLSKTTEKTPLGEFYHFYRHELIGENITKEVLTRLRFSNKIVNNVSHLVREHMFFYESTWSDSAVRRFIVRVGSENISNLFELRKADIFGMHNSFLSFYSSPSEKLLEEFKTRIHNELKKENAFS
ncbi:MAG: HD domain-containing protein, partial [Treponema sp.]|nr:HD domain-containing protein [Treponema sp.]